MPTSIIVGSIFKGGLYELLFPRSFKLILIHWWSTILLCATTHTHTHTQSWQVLAEVDMKAKAIYLDVQPHLNFLQEFSYLGIPADLNFFFFFVWGFLDVNLYESLFHIWLYFGGEVGGIHLCNMGWITMIFIHKLHFPLSVTFYFFLIQ